MTSFTVSVVTLLSLVLPAVHGHVEMTWPYPLRSKYDPQTPSGLIDYNMKSPLDPSGSNFPCKGYLGDKVNDVTTYQAGSTYNMTLEGSATHGGGSCQLSLSYDNGKTFKVIESMIGGCPITQEYKFTVPTSAPSGEALLAWTWFNLIGNREMYMDCARVHVDSSNADTGTFNKLPNMYVANVGSKADDCQTIENEQLLFPDPGSAVIYGGGVTASTPKNDNVCAREGGDPASSQGASSAPTNQATSAAAPGSPSGPTTFATIVRSSNPAGEPSVPISSVVSSGAPSIPDSTGAASFPLQSTSYSDLPHYSTVSIPPHFPTVSVDNVTAPGSLGAGSASRTGLDGPSSVFGGSVTATATAGESINLSISLGAPSVSLATRGTGASSSMLPPPPKPTICKANTPVCDPPKGGKALPSGYTPANDDPATTQTWSLCSSLGTSLIPMGHLAAGTACLPDGTIGRARPNGSCSLSQQGMIKCDGAGQDTGSMWLLCDDGGWVAMGKVAQGTICVGNSIVAAS